MPFLISGAIVVVLLLASAIRILREYERGVVFRLGRLADTGRSRTHSGRMVATLEKRKKGG